ncbi:50S ribosomal protein L29 [Saccharolobus solfataricus]|uniref:Large ribosomal subunit protein uL29 n=3 Tax=Saccharolobus solfataricus TaxID=2287 RepID=RL29_SACS2|nr:50S ribosomal protein L29 [Saccharolobus solfataricus]P58084.1 RecName: Full=Large ribosomal subunit protein uL29; AltName: Full=50S ribosomal protein L29 [Saccharolobus solfataricus P2]AAK41011.1 LSU ribosomal protein L29AB (rpl29AB) [Saccharolobus solfataricus P2]AKA74039.1 50S ribosomal protein L29 [Saccharolobus solfataricus]AKA76736.1 50S ribosomal protein L29 [Saccharolobus solfataricus]AKA79430.1 50S ribosomal protein L29 [Saccharolobus solfataricus]AZF68517.1 50S ribosomal protein 
MTVDPEELRKMETGDLLKKLDELKLELIKLRVQSRMGTLKNTASIRNTRKDIARILTVLSEKKKVKREKVENK